jgi:hypothetical protein
LHCDNSCRQQEHAEAAPAEDDEEDAIYQSDLDLDTHKPSTMDAVTYTRLVTPIHSLMLLMRSATGNPTALGQPKDQQIKSCKTLCEKAIVQLKKKELTDVMNVGLELCNDITVFSELRMTTAIAKTNMPRMKEFYIMLNPTFPYLKPI